MNDITIFPADIAEMSVSQLAALPPAQKQMIGVERSGTAATIRSARRSNGMLTAPARLSSRPGSPNDSIGE